MSARTIRRRFRYAQLVAIVAGLLHSTTDHTTTWWTVTAVVVALFLLGAVEARGASIRHWNAGHDPTHLCSDCNVRGRRR